MHKLHIVLFSLLIAGGVAACKKEDVTPTDGTIFESNKADIASYAQSKNLNGASTPNGVYYAITKPSGSTVSPENGHEVEFNYKLYALIGSAGTGITAKLVDSAYAVKPAYTNVVATNQGLTESLLKLHEGDQAVVLLPSLYGLGQGGGYSGAVPPNAPLRFDITLKRTRTEGQQIDQYLTANKLTPTEITPSGLRYIKTLNNPTGIAPTPTQRLVIKYNGRLLRSTSAFDSTGAGTYESLVTDFVPGFAEGLAKLKTGEKATIIFPSSIGYGAKGANNVIPSYAPLRFDIELVSVK